MSDTSMLRTNSATYTARVTAYLLSDASLDDDWEHRFYNEIGPRTDLVASYPKYARHPTINRRAYFLAHRFEREYNYAQNRARRPNLQDRVAEWLAGIAIGIAFDYVGIERDANMLHAPHRLTEAQLDRVTGQWFKHMAHQLMRIWDKCGIAVTVG